LRDLDVLRRGEVSGSDVILFGAIFDSLFFALPVVLEFFGSIIYHNPKNVKPGNLFPKNSKNCRPKTKNRLAGYLAYLFLTPEIL
jgi:hypothetical protein